MIFAGFFVAGRMLFLYFSDFVLYQFFVFSFVYRHDCGFFMLQNCKTCYCREDGVIEMVDYSHEDILDIRKTLMYTYATSGLFDVDFRGLFGIKPCTCAWTFVIFLQLVLLY